MPIGMVSLPSAKLKTKLISEMIGDLFGAGKGAGLTAAELIARFAAIERRRGVSGEFGYAETADGGKHFDLPLSIRVVRNGQIASIKSF